MSGWRSSTPDVANKAAAVLGPTDWVAKQVRHRGPGPAVPDHVVAGALMHDHRYARCFDGIPQGLPPAVVVRGFGHRREHVRPQAPARQCGPLLDRRSIDPPGGNDTGTAEPRGLALKLVVDPVVVDATGDPAVIGILQHPDVEPDCGKDTFAGDALLPHDGQAMGGIEHGQAIGLRRTGFADVGPVEDQGLATVLGGLDALHGPLPHGGREVGAPEIPGLVHVRESAEIMPNDDVDIA